MRVSLKTLLGAAVALTLTATAAAAQNYNLRPSYGTLRLNAGFLPDPVTRRVRGGGDHHFNDGGRVPGRRLVRQCAGLSPELPRWWVRSDVLRAGAG